MVMFYLRFRIATPLKLNRFNATTERGNFMFQVSWGGHKSSHVAFDDSEADVYLARVFFWSCNITFDVAYIGANFCHVGLDFGYVSLNIAQNGNYYVVYIVCYLI